MPIPDDARPTTPRGGSAVMSRRGLLHRAARGAAAVPVLLGLKTLPAAALQASNIFVLAQLQYRGGHWDPRPLATIPLVQEMRQRTSVETGNERRVLTARDPALFSHPFLYMTGEQAFEPFDTEELEILRRYLRFGGLMLIDDARGNKGQDFDASVRREIARLFPGRSLKILSPDHSVFRTYYLIRTLGGVRIVNPYLEGVHIGDRTPLLYCQNGLGAAWERDYLGNWVSVCHPGGESQRLQAFKLGVNAIMYAITVNYKQDLIHLPFIRRKLG